MDIKSLIPFGKKNVDIRREGEARIAPPILFYNASHSKDAKFSQVHKGKTREED